MPTAYEYWLVQPQNSFLSQSQKLNLHNTCSPQKKVPPRLRPISHNPSTRPHRPQKLNPHNTYEKKYRHVQKINNTTKNGKKRFGFIFVFALKKTKIKRQHLAPIRTFHRKILLKIPRYGEPRLITVRQPSQPAHMIEASWHRGL